eukprot:TRINITY_DN9648_c0_g2_i10.p1 TRINITY_DN9648_c0_g2~~TRINITY_DN9648_c0_g2_i10.p1  ORF type:complete len:186 (-),score=1.30 TRINITY_DN9648_c0_g2_i10:509-1066(-)
MWGVCDKSYISKINYNDFRPQVQILELLNLWITCNFPSISRKQFFQRGLNSRKPGIIITTTALQKRKRVFITFDVYSMYSKKRQQCFDFNYAQYFLQDWYNFWPSTESQKSFLVLKKVNCVERNPLPQPRFPYFHTKQTPKKCIPQFFIHLPYKLLIKNKNSRKQVTVKIFGYNQKFRSPQKSDD